MDSCNIKVAIKARPLNHKEQLDGRVYWKIESDSIIHIDPFTEKKNGEQFFFDRVFCSKSNNYDVFDEIVRPIIDRGVQGFNGTVFAYGQTASGKTFTMSGDRSNPGIIPLAINYMFSVMNSSTSREYLLRACYLEIYNEKIIDLLEKNETRKIEIQKDGLHITPLKAVVCQNAQMVIDLMKMGEKNRSIGETNMNERSSRSHTIFRVILESRNVDDDCDGAYQQSVINLVDLAGSERSSQTHSSMERFKEGCKINSSLTTLGLVIQQLSECPDSSQFINFRDSKLTRILQTSLGGNSLTAIICTVTLAVEDQTHNTLSFASRAKKIKNSAKVNENVTDETLLRRYRIQISKLNKELEGIKQNQYENDEVNEIKCKYQEEKRTNEELKERIMRLQKNMITSSVEHKDQLVSKKGYNRRRTWGGKLDNTFSSNTTLETIVEDVNINNMPRPSVPSNFGNLHKDFKTPLEPFEWDLIREEDRTTVDAESINNENSECDLSPPSNLPFVVCETPKKVLRERVNNYKSMFEMSMKENNELREFTTLEKQMFYENNEKLKELNNLKIQVDDLQTEKCESAKIIEKLKFSVKQIENEKRDIEVIMDLQKNKYEKRETELLATIEETRDELKSKEEQLNRVLCTNFSMTEKQEEIKNLEIKIKEMCHLNNTYINDIETLKSQLLNKDVQLNRELAKNSLLLKELSFVQDHLVEVNSAPFAIQFLANEGYFTLRKDEIKELDQLLEHIHNTVENLQQDNQNLKDENNNLKLIKFDLNNTIDNIRKENDELNSQLSLIKANIKSVINDFSGSSEIDVDNSDTDTLIEFAAKNFEILFTDNVALKKDNDDFNSQLSLIKANIRSVIIDFSGSSEIDVDNSDTNAMIEFAAKNFDTLFTDNVALKKDNDDLNSQLSLIKANIRSVINDFNGSSEIDVDNSDPNTLIEFAAKNFETLFTDNVDLKKDNDDLKSQLSLIKANIRSVINDFNGSSEIDVDNSDPNTLIEFAAKNFETLFTDNVALKKDNDDLKSQLSLINTNIRSVINDFNGSSEIDVDNSDPNTIIEFAAKNFETLFTDNVALKKDNDDLNSQLSLIKANIRSAINDFSGSSEIDVDNSDPNTLIEFTAKNFETLFTENVSLKKDNDELNSQLNLIKANIKSVINDFSGSSEIDVDNSDTDTLIEFAAKNFETLFIDNVALKKELSSSEQNANKIETLSIENFNLKEELLLSSNRMFDIRSYVLDILDHICQYISTPDNAIKELSKTIEENLFLKSSIQAFDKLIFECVEVVEHVKTNQLNIKYLQEELNMCNNVKNEFILQIEQLNELNANLKALIENQSKVEKEIQEELDVKSAELKSAVSKLDELQFVINDSELKIDSNAVIINQLNIELQTVNSCLEDTKLELLTKCNELEKCYQSNAEDIKFKEDIENKLQNELLTKTTCLHNALDELQEIKLKIESNASENEKLNTVLDSVKSELDEKLKLLNEMENIKLELAQKIKDTEEINCLNSELQVKLKEKIISEDKIHEQLISKTNYLENSNSLVNILQIRIEEMKTQIDSNATVIDKLNNELDTIKSELREKSDIDEFKSTQCNNLKERDELNQVIMQLQSELKEKSNKEDVLKNELQFVIAELEDASIKFNDVKSVINILKNTCESKNEIIKQLSNELKCIKSTLNEKMELIVELENINLANGQNSEVTNQLNKIIIELQMKLDDETKITNEIRDKLNVKTIQLEDAIVKENEVQTLIESMENEIQLNIVSIEQCKSELAMKNNLLTELENANSELLLKCKEIDEIKLTNLNYDGQLQTVIQEKSLIETDFNLVNKNYLELSKHHNEVKTNLEKTQQQQLLNYQNLYEEFVNLSEDIDKLFNLKIDTESNLKEEILLKSAELDNLQKQLHEFSLQQDYEKLEEEYMMRVRECDEARLRVEHLESILSAKEESEKNLRDDLENKCVALEEYKKNVEFLFMRNDSFQIRVNDFEENVLVDLNEEFDIMKSELKKKTEYEKILIENKSKLECNLNKLQEQFCSVTKELELSEERSEDLASIINVLVIEIKDANSNKAYLETCLNEAEYELLKSGDLVETLKLELYTVQRELENESIKAECMGKALHDLESKFNNIMNKKELEGCNIRNQLIDPLVDYVHDIKLKLTELNSAMISGNQSEKRLRTKVMSVDDDILPLDETLKTNRDSQPESPDIGIGFEINNLRKILEDQMDMVNTLQKTKMDMEKNINELQDQIKKLSVDNNKLYGNITLMENDLKDKTSLVSNLTNELNEVRKQCIELEEHNQAAKEQIHYSFDIDSELRNGKRNLINEINLLEPGKIAGVLTHHNLSNLLDTFVSLIMTKEQQIVTDLVNNHNKIKQQYEDQINQLEEDIKKSKEWQEQVESDNEKLCLELENLKFQKDNFPNREIEIKELTEKLLDAESQSFNYLSELQELKTLYSKTSEQNYQKLSNEFEVFKISSEQSIQDLKNKLEDLTNMYNESLSLYKDQKNSRSTLENQIEKIQSECTCLKAIIEKKDEDIKNLFDKVQLKTKEYENLIEKNSLQKEEMKCVHDKKIDELQFELNDKTQQIYRTEKLLKEMTKNYNHLVEENSSNLLKIEQMQGNDNIPTAYTREAELERDIQTITAMNKRNLESLQTELKFKSEKLEKTEELYTKLIHEIEVYKLKIISFEKQLESCYQTLKLKDDQIENYQIKSKMCDNDLIEVNNITGKLRELLKCTGSLSMLYENVSSLMNKCDNFEEEIEELKLTNVNLDNECESMLIEIKSKDDKIVEFLTQEEELRQSIQLLTEERDFLKNKCEQFKNVNVDIKKLNDEICGYEQNIYQLRKEKGQLIIQHEKELNQMKAELDEVHAHNLELLSEYNKLSETAKNLEKSLKEDIQQLNRCIVDKNAKISTLELFSKTNTDELKKKNHELEYVYKRSRDETHMLRKELRRFKEITNIKKADQCTQTVEEQNLVSSAVLAGHKNISERISKLENDNQVMKRILHLRKAKIEELQKQLEEKQQI